MIVKKGETVIILLGGRKWTVEIENVLDNERFIVDIFGLKTIHTSDIVGTKK